MKGNLLFLGTGSSSGVPEIGCDCPVCLSSSNKNKRLRPSCIFEVDGKRLLLDISPDFRYQSLKNNISYIDGLLLTHAHYDHIGGLDDLRKFNIIEKKNIPCLLSEDTLDEVRKSFHYLFSPMSENVSFCTQLDLFTLKENIGTTIFQGIEIKYFSYFQKTTKVTGYRIGKVAYISDIKEYSEEIFDFLKGVDILILSALREGASPVHFCLDDAIEFAKKVNAKNTYFTHIAHEIDHDAVNQILPDNIHLAYDGLKMEFTYEQ